MRALFVMVICCLIPLPAFAAALDWSLPSDPAPQADPAPLPDPAPLAGPVAPADPVPLSDQSFDQLFATMAKSPDPKAGEAAEAEIQRRWLTSGSDTVDLLMGWAQQSMATKDFSRALDFLDAVIALKPGYAEGWNRRATLFFMSGQYGKAFSDIEKVLALEPRHFGALAGFGMMLKEIDHKSEALAALKKAFAIDPYISDEVRDTIKELEPTVDGRSI